MKIIKLQSRLASLLLAGCALAGAAPTGEAVLRVGDTFELRIAGVPGSEVTQINANYSVDGEGLINLPYIGRVRAVDLTSAQLQNVIEEAYRKGEIFTKPTVTIFLQSSARFVNVSGEVKAPQRVPFTPDLTLLKAITAAGDFSEYADRKKVRILRGSEVIVVDVKKIQEDPSQDLKLLPGDQIIIRQAPLF